MVELSTLRMGRIAMCAIVCIALRSFNPCLAQREDEKPEVLPLSTVYVPPPGWTMGKPFYTTVEWEGQEYPAREGTRVLMQVIMDPATDPGVRAKALEPLSRLRSRDTSPQLISLYDGLREREEKLGVLRCLMRSEEPRGLPLFMNVLDRDEDCFIRVAAAGCLAEWNVRRGVAELVARLDSGEVFPQPIYSPYGREIGDIVLGDFLTKSLNKGWGFREEEIRKSIETRAGLGEVRMKALYMAEIKNAIKKWFAENKDRFPDWKPGDPLPAAPKLPPVPPGPEDMLTLSPAFIAPPTTWIVSDKKEEEVSWQGKHYPAAEGVDLLMKVALEPGTINDRILALRRLEHLGSQLRNTERIPQLMKLYGRWTDRSEKVLVLFCLARSKDQRALPLFSGILDTRKEEYLRLPAAYGLAIWNVRRGVRELVELLAIKQTESPIRYPGIIGDEAARLLSRLNYWKSWWAPDAPLQAVAEANRETHDRSLDACQAEFKKWLAANEHRFPDWKPGDPLPEVTPPKKNATSDK